MVASLRYLFAALAAVALLGGGGPAAAAADADFELPTVKVREVDGVYLLDAVARLRLTPDVRKALENGVALTIRWDVEIDRDRGWWLDADIAELAQRYRLEYHELSLQYLVTNLNTGERRSFTRLSVALNQIGTLIAFPLVDEVLIKNPARHTGYARVRLDVSALPLPLRPIAWFSSAWDLSSEWRKWSFE